MSRINPSQEVENDSPVKIKKILSDVTDFVIYDKYDKNEDSEEENEKNIEKIENKNKVKKYNAVRRKYINKKNTESIKNEENIENNDNFAKIFDSVRHEQEEIKEHKKKNYLYGYGISDVDDKTKTKTKISALPKDLNENIKDKEKINIFDKFEKINFANTVKRIFILLFSILCGSITMPFGMNPLGIAVICAADKYIFYIYSGLIISLAFTGENIIVLFAAYTISAGIKFYLKYSKEKTKVEMLSKSFSYNNLSKKDKIKLSNLVHFNDTGSVLISILICAVSGCIVGFFKIAVKAESIIYTDIIKIMLFMLMSMLFTYLYSGLFEAGKDNKTLERAGICSVIFTVIYYLAPFYIYNLSLSYIASFVFTLIAANSGLNKPENKYKSKKSEEIKEAETDENEKDINSDEEIISRFAVNIVNHDNVLSDMTRGALVGLLCGVALGDTAGAVTLGICGLVSGLFFSHSTALAVISGLISAISYSVYVVGIDALQRYIPNMMAGLTFYIPAAMFYASIMQKLKSDKNNKTAPFLDKGLLVAELPANKLNNLSDAFQGLSGIFYEISERMKKPNSNEIKAIISACIEKTCEQCENHEFCELLQKYNFNNIQKKSSDYIYKNGRLDNGGIPKIFNEECINISDIQDKINSVYCRRTEENIENDKMKIFAGNYENIAKLLQNNIKSGKEDIAFKKDMSEKIYNCLENMGIECENVIVMGERKKTVYIFGVKMANYSGAIGDITEMLERICGTCFDVPEYILRDNYIIMKNQSRNKYKIYSMQMSAAAGENNNKIDVETTQNIESEQDNINGDSVSVFHGKDGYQYGIISDGMGSGKNAALSSRLTLLLTEKLLSAGNQKDLTVEMINSMLISKSDECFSSVDLFEADLITGKGIFIKAGAAPSFVVRNGRLFKIQSSTVPAGIIENINSEQTKFDMEDGDYILMLSDGIISTFEEGAWLLEMLGKEENLQNPKELLNEILREAANKNHRKDDMSVLFIKIAEERRMTGA